MAKQNKEVMIELIRSGYLNPHRLNTRNLLSLARQMARETEAVPVSSELLRLWAHYADMAIGSHKIKVINDLATLVISRALGLLGEEE